MNCRRFQHEIYEYLDGALSPRAQAAAGKHLAECAACRERLSQERQVAESLSGGFRRATESLQLSPEAERRVLAALTNEGRGTRERPSDIFLWHRLAWPVALAASVLLLLAGWLHLLRPPGSGKVHPQPRLADGAISVHLCYIVPTYTFRQEGGFVIDALTYQTNVVNQRLPTELARLE